MTNTKKTFSDKWARNNRMLFSETLDSSSEVHNWLMSRNGFADVAAFGEHLHHRRRILDAGCGNGRVTALLARIAPPEAEIVGIDFASYDVAADNLKNVPNVMIAQGDLMEDLQRFGTFDFIYCQEVLHHTRDPRRAFGNLAARLRPGGEIAIYVYKKKAPVREFVDDHVRRQIADLGYDEAIEVCRGITNIGRQLSDIRETITVPDIPQLGIEAGTYPVQRFFYHFFMKCFWSDEHSFDHNVVVNYDWYHPQDASRHTAEEVRAWFDEHALAVTHLHSDPYGITARGVRADA